MDNQGFIVLFSNPDLLSETVLLNCEVRINGLIESAFANGKQVSPVGGFLQQFQAFILINRPDVPGMYSG
jgi:hypothetical protein